MIAQDGEERFFADCPSAPRLRVHHDDTVWDLHAVFYEVANLTELEVIRLVDWVIDWPVPGPPRRPLERVARGVRVAYARLGGSRPVERVGQFVGALQIRELSLGDAAATYTVTTGGSISPGGGTLVRLNKLIDWIQLVSADVNTLGGRVDGMVRWRLPGQLIDGTQVVLNAVFHQTGVGLAKLLDHSLDSFETVLEGLVNLPRAVPHRQTTVFLRLPVEVLFAHRDWVTARRRRVVVGSAAELADSSHAALFHPRGRRTRPRWWMQDLGGLDERILVTDRRTFADAPDALRSYVVPASWVFAEPPAEEPAAIVDRAAAIP